jgi:hypothetical protein
MSAQESRKCVVTPGVGSRLDPCKWLAALAEPSAGKRRRKGIFHAQMVDMKTCQPTRQAWTIHCGDHTEKGLHMNFCPACGTDLQPLFEHLLADAPEGDAA